VVLWQKFGEEILEYDQDMRMGQSDLLFTGAYRPGSGGLLGVFENLDGIPKHEREGKADTFRSSTQMPLKETRNLLKTAQASKVVNPFTRALAPPFIGRRGDFYIPKTHSNLKNIPNVNTYMNVFYISYIYKPATSSHTKPGLFETTSLTLLLTDP
jgi:hypothetical protein